MILDSIWDYVSDCFLKLFLFENILKYIFLFLKINYF